VSDSGLTLPAEGGVDQDAGPVSDGEIGSPVQEQAASTEAPSRQYVEVDDGDNRYVRLRANGEDTEVPFNEALRGYSRESDYTRKMQALAAQREEADLGIKLQRALEADPIQTLQLLQQRYAQQAPPPPPEFDDPLEKMIYEERQARVALEERLAARDLDEQVNRQVQDLRTQYNATDDDIRTVINIAMQQGLPVDSLPMVYKMTAFDRIHASVQVQREQQAAEEAKRQAAASASRVVSNGTGSAATLVDRADTGQPMTLRQAIESAFNAAGLQ
jgi:hypothetical protein